MATLEAEVRPDRITEYGPGMEKIFVYSPGDPVCYFYRLTEGVIQLCTYPGENGNRNLFGILLPPAFFGVMEVLDGARHFVTCAKAVKDSRVEAFRSIRLPQILHSNPFFGQPMLADLAGQMDFAVRLSGIRLGPIRGRILGLNRQGYLVEEETSESYRLTQEDLAALLGATREGISKGLSTLDAEGLYLRGRGNLHFVSRPKPNHRE